MKRETLLLALCIAAAAPVRADVSGAAPSGELTDAVIDETAARSREAVSKKIADLEKDHLEREAFALKLKNDRVAFEKKLADALADQFAKLKTLPLSARRPSFAKFNQDQQAERDAFEQAVRARIEDFKRKSR